VTRRSAHLVITGTYRSGTTLAERLVDNSSDAYCAPQPFPYLYLTAKRRFLQQTGRAVPQYPIGDGFHDPAHHPDELAAFLRSDVIDRDTIRSTFRAMQGYSGAQTPELADVVEQLPEGTLVEIVTAMHALLAHARRREATLLASKDILVEEFSPTFAAAGIKSLIVVRDPRRVVASTFGPAASAWTGRTRPLLYTVRLWRKSIAYALDSRHGVAVARLEDLVAAPADTLRTAMHELAIEWDGAPRNPLSDAQGAVWAPNTSFPEGGANATDMLSERQLAYVEALARPEMLALGYEPLTDAAAADDALTAFRPDDDPGRDHPAFQPDLGTDPAQLALERRRLHYLRTGEPVPDETEWFVRPGVRSRLAAAPARGATSRGATA